MTLSDRRLLPLAAGCLLLAVAGAVLYVLAPSPPTTFGWFAYAPLAEVTTAPELTLSGLQRTGLAVAALGLLAGGAAGGYALGLRRARTAAAG